MFWKYLEYVPLILYDQKNIRYYKKLRNVAHYKIYVSSIPSYKENIMVVTEKALREIENITLI